MKKIYFYMANILLGTTVLFCGCSDDTANLPPAKERSEEAINSLVDELIAPSNGWQLQYRPTPDAGTFLMFLNFGSDGLVSIQSDVPDNNGEFASQVIPYRVDNSLGLELIFETYGVFHYLFEQEQASFGAEFEFIFNSKEGNNLIFESKTDSQTDLSIITFEPAAANAESALAIDIAENFSTFSGFSPQISGGNSSRQQIILEDHNVSVFWNMDLLKRVVEVDIAGSGTTIQEIVNNIDNDIIDHTTGFSFSEGKLVLEQPFSFNANGSLFTIGQITLGNFDAIAGPVLCSTGTENTPTYQGQIAGIGNISIQRTLFASDGVDFVPQTEASYNVNVVFVFSADGFSLASSGSIAANFPKSIAFVFNYGLESDEEPANAVGFILEDSDGTRQTYLREFDVILAQGNMLQISLTNNFHYSTTPNSGEEQSLIEITDEIFGSGEIYAYDFPIDGLKVFNLYNPCNGYEFLLVQ